MLISSKDIRFQCYGEDKNIWKCNKCGLIQLFPQWKENELEKIYTDYHKKLDFNGQKIIPRNYPNYLSKYIKKTDKILEVGCGEGNIIRQLRQKGYNAIGIDKDKSVCDEVLIFHKDANNLSTCNKFDVIFGLHLLEHISDPCYFLFKLLFISKDRLIFELPNTNDPLLTIYHNEAFNKFYWRPDHLFFYTPQTIKKIFALLYKNNLRIKLLQRYGVINHLNWLFRNKPTNINYHIPIIDDIYKFILTKIFRKSDTMLIILRRQ